MSDEFLVTAEAIDDDVLIRLPEELGVQDGQQFEISRRLDGVVVLKFANDKTVK